MCIDKCTPDQRISEYSFKVFAEVEILVYGDYLRWCTLCFNGNHNNKELYKILQIGCFDNLISPFVSTL